MSTVPGDSTNSVSQPTAADQTAEVVDTDDDVYSWQGDISDHMSASFIGSDQKLLKEYREKLTNFELREIKLMCTNGELNAEIKAEMEKQKLMTENNELKEKVDKMEQEKKQQEEKKYVPVDVFNLLLERMKTLEIQQQQKVNAYSLTALPFPLEQWGTVYSPMNSMNKQMMPTFGQPMKNDGKCAAMDKTNSVVMGHQQQVMNDNDVQLLMNRLNNAKSKEEVEYFFVELRKTPHLFNAFLKLTKKMPIVGQPNFFQSMKNDGKCVAMDKTNSVDGTTDGKHLPTTHLPTKYTKKILSMPKHQNGWNVTFCHGDIEVSGDNLLTTTYKGDNEFGWRTVVAKLPITNCYSGIFYFEMKIINLERFATIGLGGKETPWDKEVGQHFYSYGYQSDGSLQCCGTTPYVFDVPMPSYMSPNFGAGDVVGFGVYLANRQMFFTKNGQLIDTNKQKFFLYTTANSLDALFPCVSLWQSGDKIETNFGPNFKFDLATL